MYDIPKQVEHLLNEYLSLEIANKKIAVPYFINIKHARAELRSLIGKGLPQEIKEETVIYAKLRGFSLEDSTPEVIRTFMIQEGIGIDCSGFVSHLLEAWTNGKFKSKLKYPNETMYRRFIRMLRPIENISAEILTNKENSKSIKYQTARAGDLIRLKGLEQGDHIAIILKATNKEIIYAHSTEHFNKKNGVKLGVIEINNQSLPLEKQNWKEVDENGECWTLKQYLQNKNDNGIRRPNFL